MDRTEKLTIIATLHLLNMKEKHFANPGLYPHPTIAGCLRAAESALFCIEGDPDLKQYTSI
jgi:hypothetical protein